MRSIADLLCAVRKTLAPGWCPFTCMTEDGTACCSDDESAWVFDLIGAINHCATSAQERLAAWDALDSVTDGFAFTWSLAEGRTLGQLLTAILAAEERAALEAR